MVQTTRRQILRILLASAVLLIAQAPVVGQDTPQAALKVLFVGNSYTSVNDLPALVVGLAEAAGGRKIEVDRHLVGGCTLEKHVKDQKAIDKILAAKWDVVVLQEHRLRPVIDRQAMHEYARLLDAEIKKQGAKTVFYLTWARQHIPNMQAGADPAKSPEYAKAMYQISGVSKTTDLETWCQQQNAASQPDLSGRAFNKIGFQSRYWPPTARFEVGSDSTGRVRPGCIAPPC